MHLVLISNFSPDQRANSEYGHQLYDALTRARPEERVTVLAGVCRGVPDGPHVVRAWRHGTPFVARDLVRAVTRLRPDAVLVNGSFNSWGNNLSNLLGFWALRALSTRVRTLALLHYLPQTLDVSRTGYRVGRLEWAGIDVACRLAARAHVVAFTLERDRALFIRRYKRHGTVHMEHGFMGFVGEPGWVEADLPTALAFGYWGPGKDLEPLLEAVERTPGIRLIVGGGSHPRFPGYLEAIRARHACPRIEWTGYVEEDDLPALFRRARLVVLPYARDTGTSGVLHQACQSGRAVLASDIGVLREETERLGVRVRFYRGSGDLDGALAILGDGARLRDDGEHNLGVVRSRFAAVGERWWRLAAGQPLDDPAPVPVLAR
jgi:glycosyltransferase involved in cell wall biosynthesis